MENDSLFRQLCDDYHEYSPHELDFGGGRTHVNIDNNVFKVNKWAKLALDFYNKQKQKNFNLVKVGKLNTGGTCFCMTFWAQDDGSDEHHLFRGVVCVVDEEVLFCEIKDDGKISILADHLDDYVQKLGENDEDQPSNTCKNDLGDGSATGSDGVILVSPTMFRIMGEKLLSALHKICDDYMDPCLYENCGMMTSVDVNCFDWVRKYAELAINFYNQKEQKHFNLIKVEKLYSISAAYYYCMTFWARNGRSDECRLFRAVVCIEGDDEISHKDRDLHGLGLMLLPILLWSFLSDNTR